MPQLDANFFGTQLFWLAVSFIVFYVLMSKLALPRIADVLQMREEKITGDLNAAARARDEAKAALAHYEKSLADARAEAQRANREAADAASAASSAKLVEVGTRIGAEIAAAEGRIAEAREAAMGNVRSMAVEVAEAVFGKLVGAKADQARLAAAVDTALKGGTR
jgi:F-type H+-transporting ATPase subunit b